MTSDDDADQVPATFGVPPDAPNATHADDEGLAQGPPATDEEIPAHPADGR